MTRADMVSGTIDLEGVGREQTLIDALLDASVYPHPIDNIRMLDTHISWVILSGPFAYKIKKPLKLEFLDYSTLERRKHFCEEELRLNRRWAPELYVDVVPVSGTFEKPSIGGRGDPIEYAVRMHQFPQSAQLDVQLDNGSVTEADMIALAETIDGKHRTARTCDRLSEKDARRLVQQPMLENIEHLESLLSQDEIEPLARWTADNLRSLWPVLLERQNDGFVRECHGDLKLANLVRLPSGIAAFDCVEFSADLRNIDVISDVSFLVMDLIAREREDLAYIFINRYLECSGDYAGMSVFGLYLVYHALIRAKIAAIRSIERADEADAECDLEVVRYYCSLARDWIAPAQSCLVAMHGFSGSGKTWLSQRLLARLPAIRVRSDIERKRQHGLGETEPSGAGVGAGIYAAKARSGIYKVLETISTGLLQSNQNVIVDASFLDRADRQRFVDLARRLGARFCLVDVVADHEELQNRVVLRARLAGDASEAGLDVLRYQFRHAEELAENEQVWTVAADTGNGIDVQGIVDKIRRRCESR